MTRTVVPFAAFLALIGMPAAAAELGEETPTLELADGASATPDDAVDGERSARRGGGNKGGKSKARSSSNSSSSSKARSGNSKAAPATSSARPIRAPAPSAAARSGQPSAARSGQPSAARSGQPSATRSGQPSAARTSAARTAPRTTPRGDHAAKPGTRHQQAGNGPKAANTRPAPRPSGQAGPGHKPAGHKPAAAKRPPPRHTVHHSTGLPHRWSPNYHRYHLRGVPRHSPRYWASGVFIYNPPPKRHKVVVVDGSGKRVQNAEPSRAVDRNNSFSVGIRGGSYMSGYTDGGGYGDLGLGVNLRYRPVESVGFEMSWMHHSDTWDDHAERAEDPISASVQLFAFPWTRVSPYATVGLTVTPREAEDTYYNGIEYVEYEAKDALAGPHAGLGIEFAVGKSAAIGFEGKYVGYIDRQEGDNAYPGAFQGSMGLNFYF